MEGTVVEVKLAVSNVAWYHKEIDRFIGLISELGCDGIELATSMIWDEPIDVSIGERRALKRKIEEQGLQVTGLQSLLYTRQDLKLFESEELRIETLDYFTKLMDLCNDLGGKLLIFGSPRNRNFDVDRISSELAYSIAREFFGEVGERAKERDVVFCIEPLGKVETNFINTVYEAEKFIQDIGSNGIGLHIDVKGLIDEDEYHAPYLRESFSHAMHVHINDPGLKAPGVTGFDHGSISKIIKSSRYSKFLSIEMRRVDGNTEGSIKEAINYVRKKYYG